MVAVIMYPGLRCDIWSGKGVSINIFSRRIFFTAVQICGQQVCRSRSPAVTGYQKLGLVFWNLPFIHILIQTHHDVRVGITEAVMFGPCADVKVSVPFLPHRSPDDNCHDRIHLILYKNLLRRKDVGHTIPVHRGLIFLRI